LQQGTTSQAAEKLPLSAKSRGFVTGHDFSRAANAAKNNVGLWPLQNHPAHQAELQAFSAARLALVDLSHHPGRNSSQKMPSAKSPRLRDVS
jgi:hypothetical protein